MQHQINSHDVCIQGFERLRSTREYILAIPVDRHMGPDETREALLADLQAPDRSTFTDADWEAADDAVRTFCEGLKPKPFADIEDREEGDEPCYLFLYIEPVKDDQDPAPINPETHGDNH